VAELNGLGHIAEMAPGEKSQFDVFADGELIFSKQQLGRYPEPGEVAGLLD
jgi:predicted Rdx family selenoprotein